MITEEEKVEIEKRLAFDFNKLSQFINDNDELSKITGASGLFALGVLVKLVFSIQQYHLKSTPFEKKLKGMHITSRDVTRIFSEAVEKVNQYTSQYTYKELREYIAENLLIGKKDIENMPSQEISFHFICGLELGGKFKTEKITN